MMKRGPISSPFIAPQSEEEASQLAETRKSTIQAVRQRNTLGPITAKSTVSSRIQSGEADDGTQLDVVPSFSKLHHTMKPTGGAAPLAAPPAWRPQKEDMRDFIAKKREIFLVMMTIDNKREELTKLQERAALREAAVAKGEQMLADDAARFDAFLKENDEKLQTVKRSADAEVKAKQEKIADIKRLGATAALSRSELNEIEEQLEECKAFRQFLDKVTPQDWFAEEQAKKDQAREVILDAWRAECKAIQDRRELARETQAQAELDYENARTQQEAEAAENSITCAKAALASAYAEQEPAEPPPPPPETEPKLFFQEPGQLLQIYARLEEENLFLIQATQEAEEGLEQAQQQLTTMQASLNAQADALAQQVQQLEHQLAGEYHRRASLQTDGKRPASQGGALSSRGDGGRPGTAKDRRPSSPGRGRTPGPGLNISLDAVTTKLHEVWGKCGFDGDVGLNAVQMVAGLEAKLEEFLTATEALTPEEVTAGQRAREAARRKVMREEKAAHEEREREERAARAKERAAAPVFKKKGKPQMMRSTPLRAVKTRSITPKEIAELELDRFLAQDLSQL